VYRGQIAELKAVALRERLPVRGEHLVVDGRPAWSAAWIARRIIVVLQRAVGAHIEFESKT